MYYPWISTFDKLAEILIWPLNVNLRAFETKFNKIYFNLFWSEININSLPNDSYTRFKFCYFAYSSTIENIS